MHMKGEHIMKKLLSILLAGILFLLFFAIPSVAVEKNYCEDLSVIEYFHSVYNSYYISRPIEGPLLVERTVEPGSLFSVETIISSYDSVYQKSNNIKAEDWESGKPFGLYIYVPFAEVEKYAREVFNANDSLIAEIRNFKAKNPCISYVEYDENGYALYDSQKDLYMLPVIRDSFSPVYCKYFVGYARNGEYLDVYLAETTPTDWKRAPSDKVLNVDYIKTVEGKNTIYREITDNWFKYTVLYDGNNIKYISAVHADGIPSDLIRFGDAVKELPIETAPPVQTTEQIPETNATPEITTPPVQTTVPGDLVEVAEPDTSNIYGGTEELIGSTTSIPADKTSPETERVSPETQISGQNTSVPETEYEGQAGENGNNVFLWVGIVVAVCVAVGVVVFVIYKDKK